MNKTILIVDDDPAIVTSLSIRAAQFGFAVLTASNGIAGYELAIEHGPELIVMDVHMPCQDGLQTLAKLRENSHTSATPVLIMSGSETNSYRAFAHGADGFLKKPHRSDQFTAALTVLLTAAP